MLYLVKKYQTAKTDLLDVWWPQLEAYLMWTQGLNRRISCPHHPRLTRYQGTVRPSLKFPVTFRCHWPLVQGSHGDLPWWTPTSIYDIGRFQVELQQIKSLTSAHSHSDGTTGNGDLMNQRLFLSPADPRGPDTQLALAVKKMVNFLHFPDLKYPKRKYKRLEQLVYFYNSLKDYAP